MSAQVFTKRDPTCRRNLVSPDFTRESRSPGNHGDFLGMRPLDSTVHVCTNSI